MIPAQAPMPFTTGYLIASPCSNSKMGLDDVDASLERSVCAARLAQAIGTGVLERPLAVGSAITDGRGLRWGQCVIGYVPLSWIARNIAWIFWMGVLTCML